MNFLAYSAFLLLLLSPLFAQEPDDEKDDHQRERQEYFYRQRAYPLARIPEGARLKAIQVLDRLDRAQRFQAQSAAPAAAASAWKLIGPEPTSFLFGGYVTAGRVNAIAIDPRDSNTVYIGAAEGGVWKTKDGGITWTPLTDSQPSLAMGAIVLDPTNPDIVYAGTGEENFAVDNYYGAGILKSTDGGATWTNVVGPFLRRTISALAIHPSNGQILLAATDAQGVFRSTDGGATWNSVLSGAAAISVCFDTSNHNSAYASLGDPHGSPANGVYHSTDSGLTWTAINGTGTNTLPLTNAGRIELAVAPSNPSVLYAGLQNSGEDYGTSLGIFKSIDGGVSWRQLSSVSPDWCRKQCWYDMTIHVSPKDPNVVYAGGLQIMRSLDGGVTWTTLDANFSQVHVDQHFVEKRLGPEPFDLHAKSFHASLKRTKRNLKAILLDQTIVAGVGNIYADESLFEARLHPTKLGNEITPKQAELLRNAIVKVLTRAIDQRGSSIRDYIGGSGLKGRFQDEFRAYGRTGAPCVKCETPIEKITLAGRSTHFCPRCQGKRT